MKKVYCDKCDQEIKIQSGPKSGVIDGRWEFNAMRNKYENDNVYFQFEIEVKAKAYDSLRQDRHPEICNSCIKEIIAR